MSHYNKNNRYTDYQSQSRSYKHNDYQEGYDSNQFEESSAESKILLLRGLKPTTTEEIIVDTVKVYAPIEEVKIVRDRSTGESRGFAFVEFPSIQDAKSLLQYTSGHIQIEGSTVYLSYSYQQQQQQQQSYSTSHHHQQQQHISHHQHHRANESKEPNWLCSQCGGNNFGWRNACFQCRVPKGDNVQTVSQYTGESSPTSIICVRGLEFSTNEQTLWTTFTGYSGVKDVRLVRDRITLTSRGFCFVEFHTVEDSINFMNIANNTIRVDGRLVKMVYSKGKGEESSSSIQAKNRPPLVIQDAATIIKSKDLSLFVYDPTYGYYFHSGSGLYYNPNENYYWDSINQIQYKFDNISQDYLPPSNSNTATSSTTSTSTSTTTTDTNSSQDSNTTNSDTKVEGTSSGNSSSSSNSALEAVQKSEQSKTKETGSGILLNKKISITLPTKKVSKDIEKWGKKNKELVESIKAEPLELDLVQNKKKKSNISNNDDNSNSSSNAGSESPSRSSNEGTDSSNNNSSSSGGTGNEKVDWTKYVCDPELEQTVGNVCLLCKRQFGSIDTLKKHQALSDLHKQNLEIARQKLNARIKDKLAHQDELNANSSSSSSSISSKGKTPKPQDFTVGVGGKLLEKMGWKKGEGIGKQNVVTSVIDVEIRPERAGLGSIDSGNHAVVAGDDWRTAVKKRARARFDSMNLEEEEDAAKRGKS